LLLYKQSSNQELV